MNLNFLRKFFMLILLAAGWAIHADATIDVREMNGNNISNRLGHFEESDDEALEKAIALAAQSDADGCLIYIYGEKRILKNASNRHYNFNTGKNIRLQLSNAQIFTYSTIYVSNGTKLRIVTLNQDNLISVENGIYTNFFCVEDGSELSIETPAAYKSPKNVFEVTGKSKLNIGNGSFTCYAFDDTHLPETVIKADADCEIAISGGGFNTTSGLLPYIASGYHTIRGIGEEPLYWVVSENVKAVKFVNNTLTDTYESTIDALNSVTEASEDKVTVKMNHNEYIGYGYSSDDITTANGTPVTLDLNGYSFCKDRGFCLKDNTNLTITDSSEGKTGIMETSLATALGGMFHIDEGVQLKIEDGIFDAGVRFIAGSGKLDIYGGKFSFSQFTGGGITINIYGGYFASSSSDVSENDWEYYINKESGYGIVESGIEEYPYTVGRYGAEIRYGEYTTNIPINNNEMTIDLKDDESDYSAWLSYFLPVKSEATNDIDITVKKYFANTNWHAFYAPFEITATPELLHDFEFAEIWDTELNPTDNSTSIEFMRLDEGDKIPAYTPCLVRSKSTGKKDMVFKGVSLVYYHYYYQYLYWIDCTTVDKKFTFCGVLENTDVNGYYALDSETSALVYVQNTDAQVTPFKFYMKVEDRESGGYVQNAKTRMRVIGNETTSIDNPFGNAKGTAAHGDVFNLQGVKVASSTAGLPAGIYIQSGKKIVIK